MQKESLQPKRLEGMLMILANLCSNLECSRSVLLESPKVLFLMFEICFMLTILYCLCI
ncbi:hypothetical protein Hanom_Chr12g01177491 [Helianthus anomalus]